jgi:hypothetical protein
MFIPLWLLLIGFVLVLAVIAWLALIALRRNPLPFPDPGSRIFSAASAYGKDAIVELLTMHGLKERFRADTDGVGRSIMWDGTIINLPSDAVLKKVNSAGASIGLVANDPVVSANAAADFLRSRGFQAEVVLDVEPELPIAFVTTNAMKSTVINFRKHMIHLPRPK